MRRAILLSLVILLIFSSVFVLSSCVDTTNSDSEEGGKKNPPNEQSPSIIIPEWRDYGRGTVDFDKITYTEPNLEDIGASFDKLYAFVSGEKEYDEEKYQALIILLTEVDKKMSNLYTACVYANIMQSHDLNEKKWDEAYEKAYVGYNTFSERLDKVLPILARSEIAKRLENDFFGDGFIERYKDEIYTDGLIELNKRESELVADYKAISMASVTITYKGTTDTAEAILDSYKASLSEDSKEYENVYSEVSLLYNEAASLLSKEIFLELVKVRSLIAKEEGYEDYMQYSYKALGHEYTVSDMHGFISDIKEFVIPVYTTLSSHVFYPLRNTSTPKDMDTASLINTAYKMLSDAGENAKTAYEYMLQHKLFDVAEASDNRTNTSFTTYLYDYNAPFLFVTTEGKVTDILTLSHEFGHFLDFFINDGASESLDLSEISSQAFELLSIEALDGILSREDTVHLTCRAYETFMTNMIYCAFYTLCEEYIYAYDYADITLENLNLAVERAAKEIGIDHNKINDIYYIIMPQTVITPFYMQSYATSITSSLEIFFLEKENEGAGFEVYEKLINRSGDMPYVDRLISAGLTSPFESGFLKELANTIHFYVLGYHFYTNPDLIKDAA